MADGTYQQFFSEVLQELNLPVTQANLVALGAVAHLEGLSNRYNPLNSVVPNGTSSSFNSVGVQDYKNWNQGVAGTVQLLQGSPWANVRRALGEGNSTTDVLSAFASEYATWGSHVTFTASSGAGVLSQTLGQVGTVNPAGIAAAPIDPATLKAPLTDAQAAVIAAWMSTKTSFIWTYAGSPRVWTGTPGPGSKPGEPSRTEDDSQIIADYATTVTTIVGGSGQNAGTTDTVLNTPDWVGELGTVLKNLLSGTWWKRAGIGALGVIVIGVAVYVLIKNDSPKPSSSGGLAA